MYLLLIGITIVLIWINLTGLSLALSRWVPHYAIARVVGVFGFCLLLFFIEHIQGLGNLNWAWPLTTAISLWCLYRRSHNFRGIIRGELPFILSFLYIFAWRFGFPDISTSSERLTDLYFISNYLPGSTLPPVDNWFPPYNFDYYYSLQFYGAALLGRLFNLEPGVVYQLAFCVLFALSSSLVWWVAVQLVPKRASQVLLAVAIIAGGTGVSSVMPWLVANDAPEDISATRAYEHRITWAGTRFIGGADGDINTTVGKALFPQVAGADGTMAGVNVLPLETFGYYGYLGDYHPPLSSFALLFLAIACIVWLEQRPGQRVPQGLLAASVPLMLAANAWLFPLQALLAGAWVVYRLFRRMNLDWLVLIGSGLAVSLLLYPFLRDFTSQALNTPIRWVLPGQHTPVSQFIALHWPLIILAAVVMFSRGERPLARFFGVVFILFYVMAEMIFVDDGSVGRFERTNTTMKWWGWLYAGAALTWGGMALSSPSRIRRWLAVFALVVLASYSIMLARFWVIIDKPHMGQLHGHQWITYDKTQQALLTYLKALPRGIVLESKISESYNRNPALTINAGHIAFLGWTHHLFTWGRPPALLMGRSRSVEQFYLGEKSDVINWLVGNNIDYVVWNAQDNQRASHAWATIDTQIDNHYYWHGLNPAGQDSRIGFWARVNPTKDDL